MPFVIINLEMHNLDGRSAGPFRGKVVCQPCSNDHIRQVGRKQKLNCLEEGAADFPAQTFNFKLVEASY